MFVHMGKSRFRKCRAVVLNDNLHILGGGERSSLAYARALADLGFETQVLTTQALPDPARVRRLFGDDFADIPLRPVPPEDPIGFLRQMDIHLFVNHSFMSVIPNPGRLGFYAVMFPIETLRKPERTNEVFNLNTYHRMVCNSTYTLRYTRERWEYWPHRFEVLHPPVGREAAGAAREPAGPLLAGKKRRFAHVGRFNPGLHNKNQDLLIETFAEARTRFPALRGWSLAMAGNVNDDPGSRAYFERCAGLARGAEGAVTLLPGASDGDLFRLLRESFGYVHGTGAFLAPDERPELCEHFGISIVEGMACGCVPLVYRLGGVFDVLRVPERGIAYATREELIDGYARIASLYDTRAARRIQQGNRDAARQVTQDAFTRKLKGILRDCLREFRGLF